MLTMLPPPTIDRIGRLQVVRDDLLDGGTKRRIIQPRLQPGIEYVYAGPVFGYAQIALAVAARAVGARATLFVAKRNLLHPRTRQAREAGARIVEVAAGYLTVVRRRPWTIAT
jgi:hypothetical protein